MNITRARSILSKLLLGIAYSSLIMQWLWLFVIGLPPLIQTGAFDSLTRQSTQDTPVIQAQPIEMSPLMLWIVIAITIAILLTTVIVLVRLPRAIVSTGERVVQQATQTVLPVVTHHKHLPAKKQYVISRRVRLAIQVVAAVIPGLASLFLQPVEELTFQIITTIGLGLMVVTVATFVFAWLIEPPKPTSRTQSHASRG